MTCRRGGVPGRRSRILRRQAGSKAATGIDRQIEGQCPTDQIHSFRAGGGLGVPGQELLRSGADHVGHGRQGPVAQALLDRGQPARVGIAEPDLAGIDRRSLEDLSQTLVEPAWQATLPAGAEPRVGVGMPGLVGEPAVELASHGGQPPHVDTVGRFYPQRLRLTFLLPSGADLLDELFSGGGEHPLTLQVGDQGLEPVGKFAVEFLEPAHCCGVRFGRCTLPGGHPRQVARRSQQSPASGVQGRVFQLHAEEPLQFPVFGRRAADAHVRPGGVRGADRRRDEHFERPEHLLQPHDCIAAGGRIGRAFERECRRFVPPRAGFPVAAQAGRCRPRGGGFPAGEKVLDPGGEPLVIGGRERLQFPDPLPADRSPGDDVHRPARRPLHHVDENDVLADFVDQPLEPDAIAQFHRFEPPRLHAQSALRQRRVAVARRHGEDRRGHSADAPTHRCIPFPVRFRDTC